MPKIYRITDYDIAPERIVATDVLYIEMQSPKELLRALVAHFTVWLLKNPNLSVFQNLL